MRQIRMFTQKELQIGGSVALEDAVKHHIDKVLRFKKGMYLILFNGDGYDYQGELIHLDRQQAIVQIHSREAVDNECDIDITLYCALLKGDTMDRVVQKSVELGVKKLIPVQTKHSEVSLKPQRLLAKMTHWQGIIYASTQQSGRAQIMQIEQPLPLTEAIDQAHQLRWIFSPHHGQPPLINDGKTIKEVGLLIGPEGGFHASEVEIAIACGWHTKSLGPRILRADTAAISSVLMAQFQFSQEFYYG